VARGVLTVKKILVDMKSILTECPVFLFGKSGKPTDELSLGC
jgi:hypothetical protein